MWTFQNEISKRHRAWTIEEKMAVDEADGVNRRRLDQVELCGEFIQSNQELGAQGVSK